MFAAVSFLAWEFYRRIVMEKSLPSLSDEAITEETNQVGRGVFRPALYCSLQVKMNEPSTEESVP
jgi:hypothetical protein